MALETIGTGNITYQCSEKNDAKGQYEWRFVGPDAKLSNRDGKLIGKYFGPPATWEALDQSKITATQIAVAPNGTANIPLQLAKANRATGLGAMTDVSYIQRVATVGGVAPVEVCDASFVGSRRIVSYQAGYIFYKPL